MFSGGGWVVIKKDGRAGVSFLERDGKIFVLFDLGVGR
jgi:hypothetical protein